MSELVTVMKFVALPPVVGRPIVLPMLSATIVSAVAV